MDKTASSASAASAPTVLAAATGLGASTMTVDAPPAPHAKGLYFSNWFSWSALIFQTAIIILYGTCTVYGPGLNLSVPQTNPIGQIGIQYAMFQDTHVMMALGFGFLYTLLRRYAWSGVSWNYVITVFALEWAMLLTGFWENVMDHRHEAAAGQPTSFPSIPLNIGMLILGDYVVATVLISFGAIIGRVSAMQCLIMLFFEVIFATANVQISLELEVTDPGGSMLIHTFGAAFGLAVAWVIGDPALKGKGNGESKLGTSRHNGTFAMIGTLFLFCFWPSFNAGMLTGSAQQRAVINTVLSITSSTITAFAFSKAIHGGKRFDMEHIQNSTLAGGVVIGAACDMINNPFGALLAGSVAGVVSVYGFSYLVPALKRKGITDTCGISSLHFMPGFIGGIAASIAAATVDAGWTTASIDASFPARASRSALMQGSYQMAMTVISLAFGVLSGLFTGWLMTLKWAEPMTDSFYEDEGAWNVPFDEEESPEQDDDIAVALEAARDEITASVIAKLAKAIGKGEGSAGLLAALQQEQHGALRQRRPSNAGPGTPTIGGMHISANARFTEGSVHNGVAGGGAVGGAAAAEGSMRGGRRPHGPAEGSTRAGRAFLALNATGVNDPAAV